MALRHTPSTVVGHKICNKCGDEKPLELFYRNHRMSDGRMGHCKKCFYNYNREQKRQYSRNNVFREKQRIIAEYGGKCFCCGESNVKLLTLDHSNNDGAEWKRIVKRGTMYRWLKQHDYPKDLGLRAACWNCNSGRHHNNGICPHEEERQVLLRLVA